MRIFINDIPLQIISISKKMDINKFDVIYEKGNDVRLEVLNGNILFRNPKKQQLDFIIKHLQEQKRTEISKISIVSNDKKEIKQYVKDKFTIIKAAGGLVMKDENFLLIERFGLWDLPKGKLEKGEDSAIGAVREVKEECNISVKLKDKITSTWHTYKTSSGKEILKKTDWYLMKCTDDLEMKPQLEEEITDIKWMNSEEVEKALTHSYASIKCVFEKYYASLN